MCNANVIIRTRSELENGGRAGQIQPLPILVRYVCLLRLTHLKEVYSVYAKEG
jgi:hypothetical protein